ncbi:hypothetical protein PPACK8108_LOCUS78 [Phakopsora pachyrhizi]|uniref:Uncharacterized protein n=1 Tax=Phakopsora pachyrhizi TaxID=170000 RepID=A0AAV0ACS8_PHAPC|nr:hypothetical protein PPACK8108_LOCUS78 [Phakopsora pachyrhizi]
MVISVLPSFGKAVEYNKSKRDKSHKEPEFHIEDQVLLSTVNFNNIEGNMKFKPALVGPFVVKRLHGKNGVEIVLSEEFSKKHPVSPVNLKNLIKRQSSQPNQYPS